MSKKELQEIFEKVKERDPEQTEFHQAVEEVFQDLESILDEDEKYIEVIRKMVEPERVISFRVPWIDKDGKQRVNRGYRVQFNSAIGPYKGGLRFHPSVTLSILKFLGFEQTFKNALTTLPMGGGKGGSDFNPRDKTDAEVNAFCISFMTELAKYIGSHTDIPAGDIGVGGREIGFLFGQYKRITGVYEGTLTGKGITFGGSLVRTEATGWGGVYFLEHMLKANDDDLKDKKVLVSGSGNVAQYAIDKLLDKDAKPLSASDSDGTIVCKDGLTREHWKFLIKLKQEQRGRVSEMADEFDDIEYHEGKSPWELDVEADIALPSATQNEIDKDNAKNMIDNKIKVVCELANMPTKPDAIKAFKDADVLFGPAKAANAGGVAVSGLEMSQNRQGLSWTHDEVQEKLKEIMKDVFDACADAAEQSGDKTNYSAGANISGFKKVAKAMIAQGAV